MTRFARARGSKSSNERTPADSTPWEVMKEQLVQAKKESEDSKNRKEAEQKRIDNYENFLKEQKTQKRKATWCDFPENDHKSVANPVENEKPGKAKKKNKKHKAVETIEPEDNNEEIKCYTVKKKNKKSSEPVIESQNDAQCLDNNEPVQSKKGNKKNKKNKIPEPGTQLDDTQNSEKQNTQNITKAENEFKGNKKQKMKDGKPKRRKVENDNSFKLIINGKDIELVRFDGFPVMKKDAERLQELKTNMIKKGIPKSEVQRTMKLERRRAEKALARVKREVCYNCRKGGHVLSDCPDLKSQIPNAEGGEGVCFKCGSTEHRQFECKVQRDKEFRFATCFICKEAGHIARQCPDNPKGLYPNGGSCKLCGDVTHLRKDCPTVMDKKEETTVKLHTLESGENLEDVGQQTKFTPVETSKKPKKIRF